MTIEIVKIEECRNILKETKSDLEILKEKYGPKNEIDEIKNMARSFFRNSLKPLMEAEKDELFKFDRQIEQINRDQKILGQILEKTSGNILKIERSLGVGLNRNNWEEVKNKSKYTSRIAKKI
jgi:hypothetical protein